MYCDGMTVFSTKAFYEESIDLRTDFVIVEGLDETTGQRIKSWKDKGYQVFAGVGLSYGNYNDYLNGKWDEEKHWEDIQLDENGDYVLKGPNVPYLVPTNRFTRYLYERILPLIDGGLEYLVLNDPVYWLKSGFSSSFKREWEIFYNKPWSPVDESPSMIFKASKMKSELLLRCIYLLSSSLKYYAREKYDRKLHIFVNVNGFISSSLSKVISPIGEIVKMKPIDGMIADIRPYSSLNGGSGAEEKAEIFWFASCEYNLMRQAAGGADKKVIFSLNSSDKSVLHTLAEYKTNYETVLTAALLHAGNTGFKIPAGLLSEQRKASRSFISYFVCLHALKEILSEKPHTEGSDGNSVGVFVSDTVMYQRLYPSQDRYRLGYADDIDNFASLRGIVDPLVTRGIEVNFLFVERVKTDYELLNDYNVLILSYEFMKPLSADFHYALLAWVKSGGVLLYVGNDTDSFHNIDAWWQTVKNPYASPAAHLFEVMGLTSKVETLKRKNKRMSSLLRPVYDSIFEVGKGIFAVMPEHPSLFAREESYAHLFRKLMITASDRKSISLSRKNFFAVNRGPYKIVSVLGNTSAPYTAQGAFIDLFDQNLEIRNTIRVPANTQKIYYNIDAKRDDDISILAIGAVVEDFSGDSYGISFTARLPQGFPSVCRLYLPYSCEIKVNGASVKYTRDPSGKTVFFKFEGAAEGLRITARRVK